MKTIFIVVLLLIQTYSMPTDEEIDLDAFNQITGQAHASPIYSGYLDIDQDQVHFHYMFYFADDEAIDKPIILWLNGGPGCSSLQGAFNENGPIVFKAGTTEFTTNDYSWTKFANLLYLESPIEVGFSYSDKAKAPQNDETTANYNLQALVAFFNKFTDFQPNQLFIAGESYAGIYIPTLAAKILDYNANPTVVTVPKINLEGLAIGNGCTDPTECTEAASKFPVHALKFFGKHGFYSPELYQQILAVQDECYGSDNQKCKDLIKQADLETNNDGTIQFNPYNVYGECFVPPELQDAKASSFRLSKSLFTPNDDTIPPCADVAGLLKWLRDPAFMDILNVDDQIQWNICAPWEDGKDYQIDERGSLYLYERLIKNNVRIMHFSGDVDAVVPITGTLYWMNKLQKELNLATVNSWRPWFVDPLPSRAQFDTKQNAGNVWDLDGISLVTIRNAGHMVVLDKRAEGVKFIQAFLQNQYL